MPSRLKPYELIENKSFFGRSHSEVEAMVVQYGFYRRSGNEQYIHKYDDDPITVSLSGHTNQKLNATFTENASIACMEVKRRNALLKEPVFSEIPEWAFKALPAGTRITSADNRVAFESGAVLDLEAADMPPVRHYMLEMRSNTLTIRSADYPLEAFSASFNVKGGSANVGALKAMFETLDAQVLAHTHEVEERFNEDLRRLMENHGYKIHEEQRDFGKPHWVMTHPIYGTEVNFLAPKKGQAISDETLAKLDVLLETSRDSALAQMTYVEQLEEGGWTVVEHPANGAAPHMTFTHVSGQSFDMPLYGVNKIFDQEAASAQVEAIENPITLEPVKDGPTKRGKPEIGTATIDGAKIRAGLLEKRRVIGICGGTTES